MHRRVASEGSIKSTSSTGSGKCSADVYDHLHSLTTTDTSDKTVRFADAPELHADSPETVVHRGTDGTDERGAPSTKGHFRSTSIQTVASDDSVSTQSEHRDFYPASARRSSSPRQDFANKQSNRTAGPSEGNANNEIVVREDLVPVADLQQVDERVQQLGGALATQVNSALQGFNSQFENFVLDVAQHGMQQMQQMYLQQQQVIHQMAANAAKDRDRIETLESHVWSAKNAMDNLPQLVEQMAAQQVAQQLNQSAAPTAPAQAAAAPVQTAPVAPTAPTQTVTPVQNIAPAQVARPIQTVTPPQAPMPYQTVTPRMTPNPNDDVFGPGPSYPRTPANFDMKDLTELVHSMSVKVETAVRNTQPTIFNARSKNKDIQSIVSLVTEHLDDKKQKKFLAIQMLDSASMRTAIFTGLVNRLICQEIYDHAIFTCYPHVMFVDQYIAAWDEEKFQESDMMLLNDFRRREQLADTRARFANAIVATPGFQQWRKDAENDIVRQIMSKLNVLIRPEFAYQFQQGLHKAVTEALKIGVRMRQTAKVYRTFFYDAGVGFSPKGMVQRNDELIGQACDKEPSPYATRCTMAPYIAEKSFKDGKMVQRVLQKGEVVIAPRAGNLR